VFAVGFTDCVPLVALVPVHPFEAVHEVALVEAQVSVDDWPLVIEVGDALNVTTGSGCVTVIVVD
jgi:hypothetical protein